MSYQATGGSLQRVYWPAASVTPPDLTKLAVAIWLKWPKEAPEWAGPFNLTYFLIFQNSFLEDEWILHVGAGDGAVLTPTPPANTWTHCYMEFDGSQPNATRYRYWQNNVEQSLTPGTSATAAASSGRCQICNESDTSNFWAGHVAEPAIWSGTFPSATQRAGLATGWRPNTIGLAPYFYAPAHTDPYELMQGLIGVVDGATQSADHPTMSDGPGSGGGAATFPPRVLVA